MFFAFVQATLDLHQTTTASMNRSSSGYKLGGKRKEDGGQLRIKQQSTKDSPNRQGFESEQ